MQMSVYLWPKYMHRDKPSRSTLRANTRRHHERGLPNLHVQTPHFSYPLSPSNHAGGNKSPPSPRRLLHVYVWATWGVSRLRDQRRVNHAHSVSIILGDTWNALGHSRIRTQVFSCSCGYENLGENAEGVSGQRAFPVGVAHSRARSDLRF